MEDYLANPARQATWVAEVAGAVVGMAGLLGQEALTLACRQD